MKTPTLYFLSIALLIALVSACTTPSTPQKAPEMPAQRPADFRISFSEEGGSSDHPWTRYRVGAQRGAYESEKANKDVGVWEFTPSPQGLDSLYAYVRESGVAQLVSQTEGEPSGRFGYQLEMTYAGNEFKLADQSNQYIRLEADYDRFKDVLAEVRAFVGKRIGYLKHEATATVILELGAPRPDSLSVKLEAASLIDLQAASKPGDTLMGSFTALQDNYHIVASAQVGTKEWVWTKEITLDKPIQVWLRLGKDGFVDMTETSGEK
jgi:hypothetical protein